MLAVRTSPVLATSNLFLDTPGAGPSTFPTARLPTPPPTAVSSPRQPVADKSRSRSRSNTPAGDKKYKCLYKGCDKAYTKPSRLAEHEITHTGERPFACPQCPNTYNRADHLNTHLRTHLSEDEKAFFCDREGCDKRFWTAAHLRRHLEIHDNAQSHQCNVCDASFPKAHLLRNHALTHMPEGTKPYQCAHEGCSWSFATKQKLKAHEHTHQANRYTCSHPSHDEQPAFPKWSLLQAHIHQAHPPVCPHPECRGRIFKNNQRLKDHLKVHDQQREDRHSLSMQPAPDTDEEEEASRKRKRRKSTANKDDGGKSPKLRRVQSGEAGKAFACPEEGCEKRFKTVSHVPDGFLWKAPALKAVKGTALKTHHKVVHLQIRSHVCPREGCGKAYAHLSTLRQHLAAHDRAAEATVPEEPVDEDGAALLTGNVMALKRYGCPAARAIEMEFEDGARCNMRFWRVYDVRRHLKAEHALELEDNELRQLLGDVGTDNLDTIEHGHDHDHYDDSMTRHEHDSEAAIDPALLVDTA